MTDMDIRAIYGRGRELLARPSHPALDGAATSFSLLALRLERDLPRTGRGRAILIAASDDDTVGMESTLELGWSLASDLGHRVLLVDGAFGTGALGESLGLADRAGLAELLDSPRQDEQALRALVQPTQLECIAVLPAGQAALGVVRADAVRGVLDVACRNYDFVLVQASVLNGAGRSMAFTSFIDAALLVAVEERSTLDEVTRGQRLLNDCGASRVALVLANRPRPRRTGGR